MLRQEIEVAFIHSEFNSSDRAFEKVFYRLIINIESEPRGWIDGRVYRSCSRGDNNALI